MTKYKEIYSFINSIFQINIYIDLILNTFDEFILSIKKSVNNYQTLCKIKNYNFDNFNIEYQKNINLIKGELLKYYCFIKHDNEFTNKYIVLTNDIKFFCETMFDIDKSLKFNINKLKKNNLENLINIYALYTSYIPNDKRRLHNLITGQSQKLIINNNLHYLCNNNYLLLKKNKELLLNKIPKINNHDSIFNLTYIPVDINLEEYIIDIHQTIDNFNINKLNYFNSLDYHSKHAIELDLLLTYLPKICFDKV